MAHDRIGGFVLGRRLLRMLGIVLLLKILRWWRDARRFAGSDGSGQEPLPAGWAARSVPASPWPLRPEPLTVSLI
jgi:hypothetical protein